MLMERDVSRCAILAISRIEPDDGWQACIRGKRVTVGMIVGQIGAGRSIEDLLAEYPYLERDDILEALRYAAWRTQEREIALIGRE